jgi:serine/threonine protein kinase
MTPRAHYLVKLSNGGELLLTLDISITGRGYRREAGFIQEGGFGIVYAATDQLNRKFIIKLPLNPQKKLRFEDEEESTRQVGKLIGVIEDLGGLVMQRHPGEDLSSYLHKLNVGPLEPANHKQKFVQCLEVINRLHSNGLVHRDIKPGNFILSPSAMTRSRNTVHDVDYGGSKKSGAIAYAAGSIGFIAPESWRKGMAHTSVDVFSLKKMLSTRYFWLKESAWRRKTGDPFEVSTALITQMEENKPSKRPSIQMLLLNTFYPGLINHYFREHRNSP